MRRDEYSLRAFEALNAGRIDEATCDDYSLHIEVDDLDVYNPAEGIIQVGKDLFDDFEQDSCIEITIFDGKQEITNTYIMTAESEHGIIMRLLED